MLAAYGNYRGSTIKTPSRSATKEAGVSDSLGDTLIAFPSVNIYDGGGGAGGEMG